MEDHLDYLKFVNYCYALLSILAAIAAGFWAAFSGFMVITGEGSTMDLVWAVLPPGVAAVVLIILTFLYWNVGMRVQYGSGRALQTLLAVINICQCPLGTAYGAYAIWVVWIGEDTAKEFEE